MTEIDEKKMKTWLKLYRSFLTWEWYEDINVKVLFLHLLLIVNTKDQRRKGVLVPVGSVDRTHEQLCNETKLTESQLRTAIEKLKKTGEISVKRQNDFSVYTVLSWHLFQANDKRLAKEQQKVNSSIAIEQQKHDNLNKNNKNNKEYIEEKEEEPIGEEKHEFPIDYELENGEWVDARKMTLEEFKQKLGFA